MNYTRASTASLHTIASCSPRVHRIINVVALHYTANMLLAVGAIPTLSIVLVSLTQ